MAVLGLLLSLSWNSSATGNLSVRPDTGEITVNTETDGIQFTPAAITLGATDIVIAWSGQRQRDVNTLIRARRIRRGDSSGNELTINRSFLHSNHIFPALASSASGVLLAVWEDADPDDGSGHGIFGHAFDSQFFPIGTRDFRVNTHTEFTQEKPAVAWSGDAFVTVWIDSGDWLDPKAEIKSRFFDSEAQPITGEVIVVPTTSGFPRDVRIAGFLGASPGFVASWTATDAREHDSVFFTYFDSGGASRRIKRLARGRLGRGRLPDVATCEDGRFFAVWQQQSVDGEGHILGRWFNRHGQHLAPVIHVDATHDGPQGLATVAMTSSCRAVVAWTRHASDGDEDVYARVIGADPEESGDEFRVNTTIRGQQGALYERDVAVATSAEAFFIAWMYRDIEVQQHGDIIGRWFCVNDDSSNSCGNPTCVGDQTGESIDINDALMILRASVELSPCDLCYCDVDASQQITVLDSLLVMRAATKLNASLNCEACMD